MRVTSKDSFIPHQVIIDKFTKTLDKKIYIYYSSFYSGYGYLYFFLGLTTFGAAANSSVILFNFFRLYIIKFQYLFIKKYIFDRKCFSSYDFLCIREI
jgi:hypothetical protein